MKSLTLKSNLTYGYFTINNFTNSLYSLFSNCTWNYSVLHKHHQHLINLNTLVTRDTRQQWEQHCTAPITVFEWMYRQAIYNLCLCCFWGSALQTNYIKGYSYYPSTHRLGSVTSYPPQQSKMSYLYFVCTLHWSFNFDHIYVI